MNFHILRDKESHISLLISGTYDVKFYTFVDAVLNLMMDEDENIIKKVFIKL